MHYQNQTFAADGAYFAAMIPVYRSRPALDADMVGRPSVGARCLLLLSGRQLCAALLLLFVQHLTRENQLTDWLELAGVAFQADVFYVACFLISAAVTGCCLCGWLTPTRARLESRLGIVLLGVMVTSLGWFSLVKIAELHDLRCVRTFARLHRLCPEDKPCLDMPHSFASCWLWLPVGLFAILRRALLRPWLTLLVLPAMALWPCCLPPPCAWKRCHQWWEWRELLVSLSFWIGFAALLVVVVTRAPLGRGGSHRHAVVAVGSFAIACTFAVLALTARPSLWLWAFLAGPFGKLAACCGRRLRGACGGGPLVEPGAAEAWRLAPEEWFALVVVTWLLIRLSFVVLSLRLERKRALKRAEALFEFALSNPFHSELEEGFLPGRQRRGFRHSRDSAAAVAAEDAGDAEAAAAATASAPTELQQKRRSLIAARAAELRGQVAGDALLPGSLSMSVRRSHLLRDSLRDLFGRPVTELLAPSMSVYFEGEQGIDAGGLSRDWFDSVARALVDSAALNRFRFSVLAALPSGAVVPRPVAPGKHEVEELRALFAIGRFLALAVLRERPLPLLLAPTTCKHLLLEPLNLEDLRALDPDFVRHRVERLMQRGSLAELAALICEPAVFFVSAPTELCPTPQELEPGGAMRRVTEANKAEYARLLCEFRACGDTRRELSCLLHGFWDVLPCELLRFQGVGPEELSALISGSCDPDPEEWRMHSRSSPSSGPAAGIVEWFWEALGGDLAAEDRCALLRFVTGSSRPPAGGFRKLQPAFSVEVTLSGSPEHLPSAHTCANKLVLQRYTSKAQLVEKLLVAIRSSEGFGSA